MAQMGRPKKELDWVEFEKLCFIQATAEEIAAWFNCSVDVVERRVRSHYGTTFAEIFRKKRGMGRISLRRAMFQHALKGDRTLLIWLSKNHLDMADKLEQKTDLYANVKTEEVNKLAEVLTCLKSE